ncbi:MAG: hypothetical protein CSA09_05525 [Candidatus Contendobacter odensis]|uniref:Mechanosensitive ion channel protein MscS n=1 Tax=Candidatus Contendibacter odensensis TaxID=1400860 RepID=A0A2G6PF00_9GAMM|nr:MAG: hypothetical protein CSA09_05525 [Candidatus Contendobacter odensis]
MPFRWLAIVSICILLAQDIHAQPKVAKPENSPEMPPQTQHISGHELDAAPSREEQLHTLMKMIADMKTHLATLEQQAESTTNPEKKKELQKESENLTKEIEELEIAFGELATGGKSIASLSLREEQFDWQKGIQALVRPLFDSLKRMTQRARDIEKMTIQQNQYRAQKKMATDALAHLQKLLPQVKKPAVKRKLTALQKQWQEKQEEAQNQLDRLKIQLEQTAIPAKTSYKRFIETFKEFASGHGLTLMLATGGFILTFFLFTRLGQLISRSTRRGQKTKNRPLVQVIALLIKILAVIASLLVAALILSALGDWLLLTVLFLITILIAWGLRNSLPHVIKEIYTMLGMGSIHEGQRIMYNGLPYRINTLNIYSILENPLLRGSTVYIPLSYLIDMNSRPPALHEPWFPSRENDFVILDGDIFGKVLTQTPENVSMQVLGAIKTYATTDYLALNPRNLSQEGFAIPIVFGLDYSHQGEIIETIVPQLHTFLTEQLEQQAFYPHMESLMVDFNEAAASSLNLLIVASFTGAAAADYWAIRRCLQRSAVSACNRYGWGIPFNQLMVHIAPTEA